MRELLEESQQAVRPWAEAVVNAMRETGYDMDLRVEFYPHIGYTGTIYPQLGPLRRQAHEYHYTALALCESLRPEWLPLSPMADYKIYGTPLPPREELNG